MVGLQPYLKKALCLFICALIFSVGADLRAKEGDGRTLLHIASQIGDLDWVKDLIKKGADVNAKAENGETALHLSSPIYMYQF